MYDYMIRKRSREIRLSFWQLALLLLLLLLLLLYNSYDC